MPDIAHQISLTGIGGVQQSFINYHRLATTQSAFTHGVFGMHPKDARFKDVQGYRNIARQPLAFAGFAAMLCSSSRLVHFYNNIGSPAVNKLLRVLPSRKYLFHERGVAWNLPSTLGGTVRDNASGAELVLANSEASHAMLVRKFGLDARKIRVVYNGVLDLDRLPAPSTEQLAGQSIRVGYLGRLDSPKGVHIVIEAARKLVKAERLVFFVAGAGPLEDRLRANASGLENLRFVGAVTDPYAFIGSMDIMVAPSIREPLGNVIIEAGSMRKAVIAANVDGIPEIIENGVNGVLIDTELPLTRYELPENAAPFPEAVVLPGGELGEPRELDPADLAAAIVELASDAGRREALGNALRSCVIRRFSVRRYFEELESIYKGLLRKKSPDFRQ